MWLFSLIAQATTPTTGAPTISPATAPTTPPTAPVTVPTTGPVQGGPNVPMNDPMSWQPLLIMLGVIVVFYIVMFLPESRRRKQLKKQMDALKKGDKVVTAGGIYGVVEFVGEKTVYLRSQDSKFEIAKDFISGVLSDQPVTK